MKRLVWISPLKDGFQLLTCQDICRFVFMIIMLQVWQAFCIRIDTFFQNFNLILERFNETIFDSLPTYLLNICEVCGSSQCPYCSIYNAAIRSPISFVLILAAAGAVIFRHFRIANDVGWIPPWNLQLATWTRENLKLL